MSGIGSIILAPGTVAVVKGGESGGDLVKRAVIVLAGFVAVMIQMVQGLHHRRSRKNKHHGDAQHRQGSSQRGMAIADHRAILCSKRGDGKFPRLFVEAPFHSMDRRGHHAKSKRFSIPVRFIAILGKSTWRWLRILGLMKARPGSLAGRLMRRTDPFPMPIARALRVFA
jgi:hypothetical protein